MNSTNKWESFGYGITRAYIDEGRIVLLKTEGNMSRNAINTWASLLILTMQEWDKEKPLAALHDLTHPNQGFTPYTRERTTQILQAIPDNRPMYSALVLPRSFMMRIIEMFIRTPTFRHPCHEIRIFPDKELALDWLREKLASHS